MAVSMVVVVAVIVSMIVAAMLVVDVLMIVAVAVPMMAVVMPVIMGMIVVMAGGRLVGPALGLERRVDGDDLRAEALQQCLDGVVAPDPKLALENLHRNMAVAEMPGKPRQRRQIGGARLDQRLGLGHHFDQPAIVEHQRIVGAKPRRLGKIEFDAGAFDAEQETLLRLTLARRAGSPYRSTGASAPLGSMKNAGGAWHD